MNALKRFPWLALISTVFCVVPLATAQRGGNERATADAPAKAEMEEGIPVTNALVISKCGTCHAKDEKGNLSRISWERATPEGWAEALKRMVRLNGLTISPEDARAVIKYLGTNHGLSPEEAKPVMYLPEHRIIDETNIPNDTVRGACTTCHALGRPLSWRRSKNDWRLLTNLHIALYAQAEVHFRRALTPPGGGGGGRGGGAGAAAAVPALPTQEPVDAAIDYLATAAPLHTPEWAAWSAKMHAPKLNGKWLVAAHLPGKGDYYGEMTVEAGAADAEFKTVVKLQSVRDGSIISRTGTGLVYAGYAWRGRSQASSQTSSQASSQASAKPAGGKLVPDDLAHEMREAIWFSPDQSSAEGRWFWGDYQEFGFDVKFQRATSEPKITGLDRKAIKSGTLANRVRIVGDNFPKDAAIADLDFGAGIKVAKLVLNKPGELVVDLDVAADAVSGKRDVFFRRALLPSAIAVYDRIDYIKVLPETSLSRLGSESHPKGYQQFEVVAYQRGADGKLRTADDVDLGPVEVNWSVEEFLAVYGDDDKAFVGNLSEAALFTPASDGPNPERKFGRNNYGDVWVVATTKNEKDKDGKPLIGKSYLVVTVPTYIKWDQPEVEK